MSSLTRHQTDKVGVFFVLGKPRMKSRDKAESAKPDKIYYIMYRLDGKKIEEKVGRKSERMTPAKAAKIREQRVNGISLPNTERRRIRKEQKQALESRWTIFTVAFRNAASEQREDGNAYGGRTYPLH